MKLNLLIEYYNEPDEQRAAELRYCLTANCRNQSIASVHVLSAPDQAIDLTMPLVESGKVNVVGIGRKRALFEDFFAYANQLLAGKPCMIANADIEFDRTLELLETFDLSGRFLCISRDDQCFEYSQDVWVFMAPVPPIRGDIELGRIACDNRIAYEAQRLLQVINPALSIRCKHVHGSNVRHYDPDEPWPGPRAHVKPCYLTDPVPLTPIDRLRWSGLL